MASYAAGYNQLLEMEPVGGAIGSVVNAYNNLVSVANTLYSLEDAGGLK